MERPTLDNMELGVLWNNVTVTDFVLDRDIYHPIFNKLAEKMEDVDFNLVEYGTAFLCGISKKLPSVETVEENGTYVYTINEEDYYVLNKKVYCIYLDPEDKYHEDYEKWSNQFDTYFEKLWEWLDENGYETEDDIPEGCIVPYEIQCLKPKKPNYKDYNLVKKVTDVRPIKESRAYFANDTFIYRPYYWGDSDELKAKPNFIYLPKDIQINWYKYALRGATINKETNEQEFTEMIEDCLKSLK